MFSFDEIASYKPFALDREGKKALFLRALGDLTAFHRQRCGDYRRIVEGLGFDAGHAHDVEDFPFIPVGLFKTRDLSSVDRSEVTKTVTSSGTTGQAVSRIFLDRETAASQTKALAKITSDFLGNKRLPMLIADSAGVLKDRSAFSARGAGILGFSMLGRDVTYILDERMGLDFEALGSFLERHEGEDILLFGFTFMIWEYLYKALRSAGKRLPIEKGVLIHGGGWKKLRTEAVSPDVFKDALRDVCGLRRVYNYYGMAEQTGSIFMECEEGRLHCSVFSDIVIRDHRDFSPCPVGTSGLIQAVSLLPRSYPGHVILTEDMGRLTGIDDCPCGRLGKTFLVEGRVPRAETRGCSDTYEKRPV
jgi:phenylacetate-coenzyme A ligase PaaK-like adenylate-forming protein